MMHKLLPFVYKFEHLLASIYKIGHEDGFYERSFAARFYKHVVRRTFIVLMDRVLFGVDGLVTHDTVHALGLKVGQWRMDFTYKYF